MTDVELPDVLGTGEVAGLLGVAVSTIYSARSHGRASVPAPDGKLSGQWPWWYRETVEHWLAAHGRGPLYRRSVPCCEVCQGTDLLLTSALDARVWHLADLLEGDGPGVDGPWRPEYVCLDCRVTTERAPAQKVPGYGRMLEDEQGRVMCHECGRYLDHLGSHLRTHGLSAREYRRRNGITARTSLAGQRPRERMRRAWTRRDRERALDRLNRAGPPLAAELSASQRAELGDPADARAWAERAVHLLERDQVKVAAIARAAGLTHAAAWQRMRRTQRDRDKHLAEGPPARAQETGSSR